MIGIADLWSAQAQLRFGISRSEGELCGSPPLRGKPKRRPTSRSELVSPEGESEAKPNGNPPHSKDARNRASYQFPKKSVAFLEIAPASNVGPRQPFSPLPQPRLLTTNCGEKSGPGRLSEIDIEKILDQIITCIPDGKTAAPDRRLSVRPHSKRFINVGGARCAAIGAKAKCRRAAPASHIFFTKSMPFRTESNKNRIVRISIS